MEAVRNAGRFVILRLYQRFPLWARQTGTPPFGLGASAALPRDTTTSSPWLWWIAYVMCRYKLGALPNSRGPHVPAAGESGDAFYGNPRGTSMFAFAPINEINLACWGTRNRASQTAEMIQTAAAAQSFYSTPPVLFVPEMSDVPQRNANGTIVPAGTYPYDTYSAGVLAALQNAFTPQQTVLWSQHNYYDVKYSSTFADEGNYAQTRAWASRNQLYYKNWKGGGDRFVYLSEGVYDIYAEAFRPINPPLPAARLTEAKAENQQNVFGARNFRNMKLMPDLQMFSNHEVRDGGTFFSFYTPAGRLRPWGNTFPTLL